MSQKVPAEASGQTVSEEPRMLSVHRLVERLSGARLCYGEPVQVGERTVIPVARVRSAGGGGFGRSDGGRAAQELISAPEPAERSGDVGSGGGGGGFLEAQPMGFIDISPAGARFEAIVDPDRVAHGVRAVARALTALLGVVAGARELRAGTAAGSRTGSRSLLRPRGTARPPSPRRLLRR